MLKSASLSPCGTYRYSLMRLWDANLPTLVFIMLNPSTADEQIDDPTIRRCISFAKRDGFGSIVVVNMFAFRATKPTELKACADPVGPMNTLFLHQALDMGDRVVVAWGANGGLLDRQNAVVDLIERYTDTPVYCFGQTKGGFPRHPLYLKDEQEICVFRRQVS